MLKFKSFLELAEGYTFVPKSQQELASTQYKNTKDLVDFYIEILRQSGGSMPDPIAIDPRQSNKVKVHRSLAEIIPNIKQVGKKYNLTADYGNGSRGGTGSFSKGTAFEKALAKDLQEYVNNGLDGKFKHEDFIKQFHKEVLSKHKNIQINADVAALNQRRPLVFQGKDIFVGGPEKNIGATVTDITVLGDGKPYYLSLKFGGTVTFFNAGVSKILNKQDIESGKVTHPSGKALLKIFGIDEKKYIDVFGKYDPKKSSKRSPKEVVNTFSKADKRGLQNLIETGIGYGYIYVHLQSGKVKVMKMTPAFLKSTAKPSSCLVEYPKGGSAKRIDIKVETKKFTFKFNIRNKQGGVYPTHIMCDYKFKA